MSKKLGYRKKSARKAAPENSINIGNRRLIPQKRKMLGPINALFTYGLGLSSLGHSRRRRNEKE